MTRARLILIAIVLLSMTVLAERTKLKPGTDISPQEDIKVGLDVAKDAEKQLVLIDNSEASAYVSSLGNAIVAKAPNENKFPFTFKIVDDRSINAFALPGGPIYVHRGAIEAADNEAQLAGVIGHEAGHVVLRHGMAQAIKAQQAQGLVGVLGGIFGGNIGKIASTIGGFTANSVLLRNSRDAESQADLMGTQILYDDGYDPHAMVEFFDKLAKEHKGSKTEQFFSNHPIPENRVKKVNDEIVRLGPVSPNARRDTAAFQRVKKIMLDLPEPKPAPKPAETSSAGKPAAPAAPSTRVVDFQVAGIQLRHPDNWKPSVQGTNITIAPAGGAGANGELAYGMLIDVFKPKNARNLDEATAQLIAVLRMGNSAMKIVRSRVQGRLDGAPAQLTELSNTSPIGGQESDVVITVLRTDGDLQFFVEVAPTKDMPKYQAAFRAIMDSVRLR